jgi:ABC-type glycerol-3-phosphate transport system substrate-binding protein
MKLVQPRAISRRGAVRLMAVGAGSVTGLAVLAACGEAQVVTVEKIITKEVPVEKIVVKEVPVDRVVTKVVTKEVPVIVEAAPQVQTTNLIFAHDHTSGPRGAAMSWGLERFAAKFPNINIKFQPQDNEFYDVYGVQIAAGVQSELALLGDGMLARWGSEGVWFTINDLLAKHADYDAGDWYYEGDSYSFNFEDTLPFDTLGGARGPIAGLPFQGNINGQQINLELMEGAGIDWPTLGNWQLEGQFLDDLRKATDAEAGVFGLNTNTSAWIQWAPWGWALADDPNIMYRDPVANRTTVFDSGADRGVRLLVRMVLDEKVANPLDQSRELAGEFGDPFSSGRTLIQGNGGAVGSRVTRIKDRFPWSLAPMPDGPRGPAPHEFTGQPHLITNQVETRGNAEQAVEVLMFFAGPEVQGRIAVDRGK